MYLTYVYSALGKTHQNISEVSDTQKISVSSPSPLTVLSIIPHTLWIFTQPIFTNRSAIINIRPVLQKNSKPVLLSFDQFFNQRTVPLIVFYRLPLVESVPDTLGSTVLASSTAFAKALKAASAM